MTTEKAEDLLDDLSTDGTQIYSDKIQDYGSRLLSLTNSYGFDIPHPELSHLNRIAH